MRRNDRRPQVLGLLGRRESLIEGQEAQSQFFRKKFFLSHFRHSKSGNQVNSSSSGLLLSRSDGFSDFLRDHQD